MRTVLIILFIITFCCLAFCTAPADEEEAEYAAEDSGYQETGGTDPAIGYLQPGGSSAGPAHLHPPLNRRKLAD